MTGGWQLMQDTAKPITASLLAAAECRTPWSIRQHRLFSQSTMQGVQYSSQSPLRSCTHHPAGEEPGSLTNLRNSS